VLLDNDDQTDELICEGCDNTLESEPRKKWMAPLCKAKHSPMPAEAIEKMRQGGHREGPRGAQTEEAKRRISGNGRKHGAYAVINILPRAAHGKLAACATCPFASSEVNPQGDGRCERQKWLQCAVSAPEIFAFYAARGGQGNDALKEIIGDVNAQQLFLMKMALNEVFRNGITIEEVIEKTFKEGSSTETRVKLNPAVQATAIFAQNLGGIDLNSQQMTPKSQTDKTLTADLGEALNRLTGKSVSPLAAAASTLALPTGETKNS